MKNIYNKIKYIQKIFIMSIIILIPIITIIYTFNINGMLLIKNLYNLLYFRLDIFYKIFLVILILFYFINLLCEKKKPTINEIFTYIFIIVTIISTITSFDLKTALNGFLQRHEGVYTLLFYAFLYLNCIKINDKKVSEICINLLLTTTILQFIACFTQISGLFGKLFYLYRTNMIVGLTGNSNYLGSLICMTTIISILIFYFKKDHNYLYIFFFILNYIVLLLSQSTGAFLSFILTLVLFIIYLLRKKKFDFKKILFILSFLTILYPVVLNKNDEITPEIKNHIVYFYNKIFDKDKKQIENDNTYIIDSDNKIGNNRIKIWKVAFEGIKKRPLLGYGPDNFAYMAEEYWSIDGIPDKAHNIYLNIWVSSGVFAILSYLVIVINNIVKGLKSSNNIITTLTFGVIAYSIQGMFGINVLEVTPYFYIVLGLLTSNLEMKDEE